MSDLKSDDWGDQLSREYRLLQIELTQILCIRLSWADRMIVWSALAENRRDYESMKAEQNHLFPNTDSQPKQEHT